MKSGLFHCSIRQLRRADSTRTGRAPSAARYYDYILRRGDYSPKKLAKARRKTEREERLIFSGGFSMPRWGRDAKNDASKFWKMADEFERANGRLALKIVVAIPRGIPRQKLKDLIEEFARRNFKNHPMSFAIHEGRASDGGTNLHVHFVVTERKTDEFERSAELFFRRANPSHPELGGAKKDRAWHDKDFFRRTRKSWADCCNKFLVEANADTRVDHRSYAERGISKVAGTHEGPHRLAMKARGVPVRARQKEIRDAELTSINHQIRDLRFQQANEDQLMKAKPVTNDSEAAAAVRRGRIALQNLPLQDPEITIEGVEVGVAPVPNEFGARIHNAFRSRGWQVEWLHAATKPGQLPSFRARHPDGFEIEFRHGRATASSAADEALRALVFTAQKAGWKSVQLSGTKDACQRMEILCREAGLKVTNPITDGARGAATSPAADDQTVKSGSNHVYPDDPPPPPPGTATKPKLKLTKKQRDEIGLDIADKFWSRKQIEEPYFSARVAGSEEVITGTSPHHIAREVAWRHGDIFTQHGHRHDLQHELNYVHRIMFHLVTEHGVDPSKIKPNAGMQYRLSSKTFPWSSRLTEAVQEFSERTGESIPEVVQKRIEEQARDSKAAEQAVIPLEPEPE